MMKPDRARIALFCIREVPVFGTDPVSIPGVSVAYDGIEAHNDLLYADYIIRWKSSEERFAAGCVYTLTLTLPTGLSWRDASLFYPRRDGLHISGTFQAQQAKFVADGFMGDEIFLIIETVVDVGPASQPDGADEGPELFKRLLIACPGESTLFVSSEMVPLLSGDDAATSVLSLCVTLFLGGFFFLSVTDVFAYSMVIGIFSVAFALVSIRYACLFAEVLIDVYKRQPFHVPHSVHAAVFYTKNWNANHTTTIGLTYAGSSGIPYSVCYNGDLNGDGAYNDLLYIPTDAQVDRMRFTATADYTARQQQTNFKAWLARDGYTKGHRGEYYRRNGGRKPFENHFDFHFAHRINFRIGKAMRGVEFSLDLVNVGNLFCKAWGRTSVSTVYYNPVTYKGGGNFQFLSLIHI